MFLFSCAYAYAYVACVMLIAQVGTRLKLLASGPMLNAEELHIFLGKRKLI